MLQCKICLAFSIAQDQSYDFPGGNEVILKYMGKMPKITTTKHNITQNPRWRHQMETFSALLAICAGHSPVPGECPTQRPVTRSFDVYFDLRPNKRLSKQSLGWWFETLSPPLWPHRNVCIIIQKVRFVCIQLEIRTWLSSFLDETLHVTKFNKGMLFGYCQLCHLFSHNLALINQWTWSSLV